MMVVHCKVCGQWCEEDDVYCSKECRIKDGECDCGCEDGHLECDSCRGTGAGVVGWDSKCSSCGGKGWTVCECVEEARASAAYDRRKADKEDRLIESMED